MAVYVREELFKDLKHLVQSWRVRNQEALDKAHDYFQEGNRALETWELVKAATIGDCIRDLEAVIMRWFPQEGEGEA